MYQPTSEAQELMRRVQRDVADSGFGLGYGRSFHFYTPLPKFRKHEDECIVALELVPGSALTGQDSALLIRYYRGKVRLIPIESTGPVRLINYLKNKYQDRLVVSPKPFVPFRIGMDPAFAKTHYRWHYLLPPDALNHC